MIFTSLGLLLVAAGMLIAGIAKSSVALLMTSLLLTIASGVVLIMALATARRLAGVTAGSTNGSTPMVTPQGQPVVLYVQAAPPDSPTAATMPAIDLTTAGESTPFIGYDMLTAKQVSELIDSGSLTTDQLARVREYERQHAARRTVLSRLDKMLAST